MTEYLTIAGLTIYWIAYYYAEAKHDYAIHTLAEFLLGKMSIRNVSVPSIYDDIGKLKRVIKGWDSLEKAVTLIATSVFVGLLTTWTFAGLILLWGIAFRWLLHEVFYSRFAGTRLGKPGSSSWTDDLLRRLDFPYWVNEIIIVLPTVVMFAVVIGAG